ncbi:MAG: glycosyltransferase family 39 protein [Candidatus Hodarchaeota archaeon]
MTEPKQKKLDSSKNNAPFLAEGTLNHLSRRISISVEILSVVAICALALLLRIWNLEWSEFKGDEAFWCFMAEEILTELENWLEGLFQGRIDILFDRVMRTLVGEGLPVSGQLKLGLQMEAYGGPIVGYIVAIGYYLFGWNPVAGTVIIAILNVLGVLLTYFVGRRLYNHQVGLISAALLATSPWFVLFSRKIWTSVNFPWLVPLLLLALWSCARVGRGYAYFTAGVSLGIAAQLHLTGFSLIPPALIFLLLYGKKFDYKNCLLLGLGVLLGYLPLIIFDLEENWLNFRVYQKLATDPSSVRPDYSGGPPKHREEVFKKLWNLTVGSGLDNKLGPGFHYGVYDLPLDVLLMTILVLSFFALIWQCIIGFMFSQKKKRISHENKEEVFPASWKPAVFSLIVGATFFVAYLLIKVEVEGEKHDLRLFLFLSSLAFLLMLLLMPLSRAISTKALNAIRSRLAFAPANDFLLFITFGFIIFYNFWGFTGKAAGVVHIHYLNVLFPLPFLIVSRGLQLATNHLSKPKFSYPSFFRVIPWILVLLFIAQNLIIVNRAFFFIEETGGEGEYGTTFASKQQSARFILNHSRGSFRVHAGYTRDFSAYSYIFELLTPDGIDSRYPYLDASKSSTARFQYTIVEPNNHPTAYENYNSSAFHQLIAQFQGIYIFFEY